MLKSGLANLKKDKYFLSLVINGKLKVTRFGRIVNTNTQHEYKAKSGGYNIVSYYTGTKVVAILAHRLVWIVYKGLIKDPSLQINHKDGIRTNNRLSNLELCTPKYNVIHAIETGLNVSLKGEAKPNSVFSDREVRTIRKTFATLDYDYKQLAIELDVHRVTLLGVLRCETYSHVKTKYDKTCKFLLPRLGRGNRL